MTKIFFLSIFLKNFPNCIEFFVLILFLYFLTLSFFYWSILIINCCCPPLLIPFKHTQVILLCWLLNIIKPQRRFYKNNVRINIFILLFYFISSYFLAPFSFDCFFPFIFVLIFFLKYVLFVPFHMYANKIYFQYLRQWLHFISIKWYFFFCCFVVIFYHFCQSSLLFFGVISCCLCVFNIIFLVVLLYFH